MSDRASSLEALRQVHTFPGPFVFKVIGANTPEFVAEVVQAVVVVLGPKAAPEVRLRQSTGGRHQAVTLSVHVPSPEAVLEVYSCLQGLSGVRFLL